MSKMEFDVAKNPDNGIILEPGPGRGMELEPEIEIKHVGYGERQVVVAASASSPPGGNSPYERELEKDASIGEDLPDVVCIFTNPNQPGIMFHVEGREPKSREEKYINEDEESYITTRDSVSDVDWDKENNVANGTKDVVVGNTVVRVRTIIVSEQKMEEIRASIARSNNPNRVVINTGSVKSHIYAEQNLYGDNRMSSDKIQEKYDNFQQVRDNYAKSIEEKQSINEFTNTSYYSNVESIDINSIESDSNINSKGIK